MVGLEAITAGVNAMSVSSKIDEIGESFLVRLDVKKTGFTHDVINCEKNEYYSHALSVVVDGENRNE